MQRIGRIGLASLRTTRLVARQARSARSLSSAILCGSRGNLRRVVSNELGGAAMRWAPLARFSTADLPSHQVLPLPALSPTMEEGRIVKWHKKEGDSVQPGDLIAEVETDKATVDYEAQEEGFIARILVPEGGSALTVGAPLAVLVESAEDVPQFKDFTADAAAAPASAPEPAPAPAPAAASTPAAAPAAAAPTTPAPATATGDRIFASPLAKSMLREVGVELGQLRGKGSGPSGRVIKVDVETFLASGAPAQAATATAGTGVAAAAPAGDMARGFEDVAVSQMRRVIAQRLTESKQSVPHYYLTADVELDELMRVRSQLNSDMGEDVGKLSVNDFLVKASALAMREVPEANSSWLDSVIRRHNYVDVSVAVAVPDGLITPVVRDVDKRGLLSISTAVRDLATRARERKLAPEEFQGGTFTISNLGMFGIKQFSAIINPPQACILAVGAAERRVLPNEQPDAMDPYRIATVMSVTLSCDHRVVDGAVGAQWLQAFKKYLENPLRMLL
eukprot:CAMPEP_0196770918 /NCGR_PEP_ID=MMETSP1104-20130614/1403_1 /TAXON_ID=33652 /ORGANISM="Cafeteria sp., Strain Caron Lab Isolate" /LENGTH=506 /DNA_ID=CAMNT_0042141033 /DNA_START=40 /DNA_END=1560 /DNA_ORIENTATION=+